MANNRRRSLSTLRLSHSTHHKLNRIESHTAAIRTLNSTCTAHNNSSLSMLRHELAPYQFNEFSNIFFISLKCRTQTSRKEIASVIDELNSYFILDFVYIELLASVFCFTFHFIFNCAGTQQRKGNQQEKSVCKFCNSPATSTNCFQRRKYFD